MSTQTTMMDAQAACLKPVNEDFYGLDAVTDIDMDALLALEEAEIRNMQISEGSDLAELVQLISDNALEDLDAIPEPEYWPLAS